jgi:hypothetical protein
MSYKKLSDLVVVSSEDIKPLYSSDEIKQKLAIAVNGVRTGVITEQNTSAMIELMYSLACSIDDLKK